ncbi:GDSL-type esterase/lipase family protein [Paenibacillus mucilaginosus]|uniref:Lipolytic protein G-D-S-L family n=1 Tax=Paenibacillus mucilaginosus (strain KNP414) TaxID=1036673 RepID=F8F9X2_PAEMK|nr:GDSL-type esterase/lipase family protein [Paenibacillus mucilaginosus]AEI45170.1 lipolytic protein G-D-S-L family [Paenibacillus mucilaginosus KNP414]MCG7212936.1 GDSL-type esterase/lipase family protein [Paenibacillus mucilaginosus]WDM26651.1 GDSL family lipase [Paenibacillus mucilaginosus]
MTGSRSRSVGKSFSYLALGDSLTAGVGAFGSGGFVRAYGGLAGEALNRPVETGVIGIPGATTGELRMLLERSPQLRGMAREAQLLTLTAGGNDLIDAAKRFAADRDTGRLAAALERCHEDYAALLQALRRLKSDGSGPYVVRAALLYNPLPGVPEAADWVKRCNRLLGSLAGGSVKLASLYGLFEGRERELLSADGIHPNAAGYRVIAGQLHRLGYGPLA